MADEIAFRIPAAADAEAMSALLIASIRDLCAADHGGDPARLAAWLANKTPEGVRGWIERPVVRLLLAEVGGALAGVGGWRRVEGAGEVSLLYVAPGFRFRRVSAALLARIEAEMAASGLAEARLETTRTARRFYAARGWRAETADGKRMGKRLAPRDAASCGSAAQRQ